MLYRLTTALTPRQFLYVGFKNLHKSFTAPRANDFTIEYYDHNIIHPNQDHFLDDDRFANPQLTKNFSLKHHTYSPKFSRQISIIYTNLPLSFTTGTRFALLPQYYVTH